MLSVGGLPKVVFGKYFAVYLSPQDVDFLAQGGTVVIPTENNSLHVIVGTMTDQVRYILKDLRQVSVRVHPDEL